MSGICEKFLRATFFHYQSITYEEDPILQLQLSVFGRLKERLDRYLLCPLMPFVRVSIARILLVLRSSSLQ
ncbi:MULTISPECIES: hypothetical protein [Methanohalophilus]|jgi:hypothetical protein|uniref:hypothetical protein n=1 Tax=Methanohalophilus TaxID=2175 RepID=UPI001401F9C8|nr:MULTISPECIES: hypothetical protein [Methanohalophilus]